MGKLNVAILRYLTNEHFRVLTAIEMGLKNHELVPHSIAASIANLKHGGVQKILRELCKFRLLCYERGKRFDGYRLTNMGYDYLALHSLCKRDTVAGFGNQIGVGKESNIYVVNNADGDELCLKLHRLGRTCFRNVNTKRDYNHKRKVNSWLYLSRLSATKEFAYMNALYTRGFSVPKPIDCNRHCVIMQLIHGRTLANVLEVQDVDGLYNDLMNVVEALGNAGVIHGDFNEFNIMLKDEDESPVIIDFPQIVSACHENAQMYFERDVNCIRNFFERRFNYTSELYPVFSDLKRTDDLDVEVLCTGVDKHVLIEHNVDDDDDDNDWLESNDIDSISDQFDETICNNGRKEEDILYAACKDVESNADLPLEANSDTCETFSCVSSATTIPPEEIRNRVKKQLFLQKKKRERIRNVAKGEANVVTRVRRENTDTIKQHAFIWES